MNPDLLAAMADALQATGWYPDLDTADYIPLAAAILPAFLSDDRVRDWLAERMYTHAGGSEHYRSFWHAEADAILGRTAE